jgi:late competence protein required for DNA uptake (superfamily II DNA/RNA helicase)
MGRAYSTNGKKKKKKKKKKMNADRILVVKREGKRPLATPRHRWLDNMKMNLRARMKWLRLD